MKPPRKLRIGILGAGRGMTFAHLFDALPESETAAVCDANPARLKAAADALRHPGLRTFACYENLLAADVDAVVVASAAPDHARHVCQALDAGKPVLSEVPADVTLEGCRQIVAAARRTGLPYMLAENCCYWGYIREYRRVVASGRIGDVLYAEGEYIHYLPELMHENPELGEDVSLDRLLAHPRTRRTWRATLQPITYLTHDLGPLLEILEDRCVSVTCLAAPSAFGPDYAPAAEVALFRTAKNRVIKILCAFSLPRPGHHFFTLMGTRGSLESPRGTATDHLLYVDGENMAGWSRMAWDTQLRGGPAAAASSGHGGADWHVARGFLDCLLHDAPPPIGVFRAMDFTLPGVCAVESAARHGAPVPIPDLRNA